MRIIYYMILVFVVASLVYSHLSQTKQIVMLPFKSSVKSPLPVSQHERSYILHSNVSETNSMHIRQYIEREALLLYEPNQDTSTTELRLRKKAQVLNRENLSELAQMAIDERFGQDQRTLAVYLLSLKGPDAQDFLLKVFLNSSNTSDESPPPHSIQELENQHEIAIRTMALEAIETNLHNPNNRQPLDPNMKLENNYLSGLLKIVRLGYYLNRPILKEFIDKNLNMENL